MQDDDGFFWTVEMQKMFEELFCCKNTDMTYNKPCQQPIEIEDDNSG
jgi:hypothetical protein